MSARPLLRVSVAIAPGVEDAVMELMAEVCGQPAAVYTDAETRATSASVYLPDATAWDARCRAKLREGLRHLQACGLETGSGRISTRAVRREDWAESWKRHFRPLDIAGALLIKPSWSRRQAKTGQRVVILDPGLSFGTGQHPTTRFCLEQLAVARKKDGAESLLDMGTGSGILAIAAAKLRYRWVEAFDFDPDAVRIATANARRNRVQDKLSLRRTDLTQLPLPGRRRYDVVCANLLAGLLVAERARILARLAPRGRLVLAGILRTQFEEVREAYAQAGWRLLTSRAEGEWRSGSFTMV